jgi:hypothetical protein
MKNQINLSEAEVENLIALSFGDNKTSYFLHKKELYSGNRILTRNIVTLKNALAHKTLSNTNRDIIYHLYKDYYGDATDELRYINFILDLSPKEIRGKFKGRSNFGKVNYQNLVTFFEKTMDINYKDFNLTKHKKINNPFVVSSRQKVI